MNYEARFPERAGDLANWVLARSENPYAPFGRMGAGAKSIPEYQTYVSAKNKRHDESKQQQADARRHRRICTAVLYTLNTGALVVFDRTDMSN